MGWGSCIKTEAFGPKVPNERTKCQTAWIKCQSTQAKCQTRELSAKRAN